MADERTHSKWTILRRALSVLLLVSLLSITVTSAGGERLQVCRDQLTEQAEMMKVCRSIAATDPSFVVGLFLALIPLAPDVQRLQVGSLISVERRLEATEASNEALRAQVAAIVMRQDVRQEQRQYFYMGEASATGLVQVVAPEDELRRKEREFLEFVEEKDGD